MKKIMFTLLLISLSTSSFGKSVYFMNFINWSGELTSAIKTTTLDNNNTLFELCLVDDLKVYAERDAHNKRCSKEDINSCSLKKKKVEKKNEEKETIQKELRGRDSIGHGDVKCQVIGSNQGYSEKQLASIDEDLQWEARKDYIEDGAILGISFMALFMGGNKINKLFKFKPDAKKVAAIDAQLTKVERETATTLGEKISKARRKARLEDDIDYEVRRKQPGGIAFRYGWPSVFLVGTYYKATIMDADTRERAGMIRAVLSNGKTIDVVKLYNQDVQELNNFLNDALNEDWD